MVTYLERRHFADAEHELENTMDTLITMELSQKEIKMLIKSANTRLKKMDDVIETWAGWNPEREDEANEWLKSMNWPSIGHLQLDHTRLNNLKRKLKLTQD